MKKFFGIFFMYLLFSLNVSAQSLFEFKEDFEKLAVGKFADIGIDSLLKKYNHLLYFSDKGAILAGVLQNKSSEEFSLMDFRFSSLYELNIDMLLQDSASKKNQLGCLLAAAVYDKSRIPFIEAILKKTDYKDFRAACALISLQSKETEPVIKTILHYSKEPIGAYLIERFLEMESNLLEKFGTDNINSTNTVIRYLAIRSLSKGRLTSEKDKSLRDIAGSQDSLRGWAIAVLAEFNSNHMAGILQPFMNDTVLRPIALKAVANSSSSDDIHVLDSLIALTPSDRGLLEALKESSNILSQKKWLKIIREREIPHDYFPFIERTKIIENDELYDEICLTIKNTTNYRQIFPLFNYFLQRKDDKSTSYLLTCLTQKKMSSLARANIIRVLRGRESELIKSALPSLMQGATKEDLDILELLLEYKNFNFKSMVSQWVLDDTMDTASRELCNRYLFSL
ncbi:hypothetical protein HQN86_01405 [Pedobacter panaciterrae]|uniref:hypothetical protein n=1 Tax=Pedobacter panaciterrae TaxID=363849 RepID=UPI00155D9DB9|nr:hypothetical protein [Pedobacter panaciterrae]NQX52261.1 hypothetical protein [Pedobacter panaciterrae]